MIKVNNQICDLCGACVSVCPENALELFEKQVEIDHSNCILCERCLTICPVNAIFLEQEDEE